MKCYFYVYCYYYKLALRNNPFNMLTTCQSVVLCKVTIRSCLHWFISLAVYKELQGVSEICSLGFSPLLTGDLATLGLGSWESLVCWIFVSSDDVTFQFTENNSPFLLSKMCCWEDSKIASSWQVCLIAPSKIVYIQVCGCWLLRKIYPPNMSIKCR